jgi:hypothetical protein
MFKLLILLIFSIPSYCFAINYGGANLMVQQQNAQQDTEILNYLSDRMEYEKNIRLDEKGSCYSLPGGQIIQIIRINKQGVIDLVVSNIENDKSKCFKKTYLGTKFKEPPKYPIYQQMHMGS